MSTSEIRTFVIRAGLKRNYGKHEVYYEISEQIEVADGQQRRDAFQNLQAQLEDQIRVYEAVSLPHVRLPQESGSRGNVESGQDSFPLETIIVESKSGKRYVSATGGKWKKYGVPIYKECDTELDIEALHYGVHDMTTFNITATIEIVGGKAKRVVAIK